MTSFWLGLALWQRLAFGGVVAALFLAGGLAWISRAGDKAAGDQPSGVLCPVPTSLSQGPSGDATPQQTDVAPAQQTWTPAGNTELATFALG